MFNMMSRFRPHIYVECCILVLSFPNLHFLSFSCSPVAELCPGYRSCSAMFLFGLLTSVVTKNMTIMSNWLTTSVTESQSALHNWP